MLIRWDVISSLSFTFLTYTACTQVAREERERVLAKNSFTTDLQIYSVRSFITRYLKYRRSI